MAASVTPHPSSAPAIHLDNFQPFVDSGQAVLVTAGNVISAERCAISGAWAMADYYWGARNHRILFARKGQQAPVLTFRPAVTGRYAIYVCAFGKRAYNGRIDDKLDAFGVFVKLGTEACFTPLMTERGETSFEELYFKTADLNTDSTIELGQFSMTSYVTSIKLVPESAKAVPRTPRPRGKVIGILDFADDVPFAHPRDKAAACAVRRHADMGFDMVMWKAGNGTICEYHTNVGVRRADDNPVAVLMGEFDPLRQAADEAHRAGIAIYGWSRLLRDPNTQDGVAPPTPFHAEHPHMVQRYADGRPSWRLSFAYPEARRYMIDMFCEMAGYGLDGVFLDVLRHPPVVAYDQPIVDAFIAQTGIDPRLLPGEGSEQWLRFRCEPFTQFLRELRSALNAGNGGRRYPLIVRTVDMPWKNMVIGCDVSRWLAEGILDGIIFAPHCPSGDNYPEHMDLTTYVHQSSGKTGIFGQVWRNSSAVQAEIMAADLYAQGVNGVCLYESNLAVMRTSLRQRLWRFGEPGHCRAL